MAKIFLDFYNLGLTIIKISCRFSISGLFPATTNKENKKTTFAHDKQRKQGHTRSNEFNQSGMTHDFELTAFYTIGSLHEFHESNCFQPTRIRLLSLN